jgi:hypothetical protein
VATSSNPPRRRVFLALAVPFIVGCAIAGGTLGGREKCWPESERRAPSIWRGILRVDALGGGRLDTFEGEAIPLAPGALRITAEGLAAGGRLVAGVGDDVTLYGGAGADGFLVVCGVEENRSGS